VRQRLGNFLKSPQGEEISKNLTAILIGIFAFQLSMFVTGLLFKKSVLWLHAVIYLALILAYLLFKDKASDSARNIGMKILKIGLVVLVASVFNHLFISGLEHVTEPKIREAMSKVMLFVDLAVIVGMFSLFQREEAEELCQRIQETSVLELIGGEEVKPGDIIIGTDVNTKRPVRLPLKDRYLHMLILGPTGAGKTSQMLLPIIHQDMQNPELGITVLEPKGDLAEKVFAMAKYYGRKVQYFNPTLENCPYFNPIYGDETDAIENIVTTFKMLTPDSPQYFQDMNENLIRNAMKVIKRLYGNDATLLHLETLIQNTGGDGEKMVKEFMKLPAPTQSIMKENRDIAIWFLQDYFTGSKGSRTATKTYEHTSGVRSQVMKLTSNKYLRKVLNPPPGHGSDIDFDKALEEGTVIAISTAQGKLRDLGRFLGYFMILQFQSAVFRRPGNEYTRRGHMLVCDEFQVYANPGFEDLLTQGRSYRVASHLATQTRALIGRGGQSGKDFLKVVDSNARNIIVFPGGNGEDAEYYETIFGEIEEVQMQKGISRQRLTLANLFARFRPETESVRETKELKPRYSATDIIYQDFGKVFYRLIKNNSIQEPGICQIHYIPKELNDTLDRMVEEFNRNNVQNEESDDAATTTVPFTPPEDGNVAEDDEGFVDPLALLGKNQVPTDDEDDEIFIGEQEPKAKTQSDVVDLDEDADTIEL
jgi:type IV secretory pathway TraG/TraD family ATPase VirD4